MCLYPTIRKNPKYKSNKKNRGIIPPVSDIRVMYVPTACGNCMECRKQKARNWQVRLLEDIKEHKNGKFITLTFSNESIKQLLKYEKYFRDKETGRRFKLDINSLEGYEKDNEIATIAMRLFLERWRKKYKKSLRHWMVTELGHKGTENIHIHGIIWTDETMETVEKIWNYGYIWKGQKINLKNGKYKYKNYVNGSTVNYIIKYVHKQDEIHKTYKSIILTSDGIGRNYTTGKGNWLKNKYNNNKTNETYRTDTGHKIAMPTYWRNKIYTEDEREKLWIQKLDKQERWVCGERVDISKGEENYYRILEHHRKKNKQLGYGDNNKDWSRAEYEKQRRNLVIKARTK